MRFCTRRPGLVLAFGLATLAMFVADLAAQAPAKRPIKHADYEIWNSASGYKLSPDGKYLAYAFIPAEGDGAVVVKNLVSGAEVRIPSGGKVVAKASEDAEATPSFGGGAVS